MTEYGKTEWKSRSRKRRQMRDDVRERFTSEAGTKPSTSFDDAGLSPKAMRRRVVSLMKVTRDGDMGAEHVEALTMAAKLMASIGFGAGGPMADIARTVSSPHSADLSALSQMFTMKSFNRFQG